MKVKSFLGDLFKKHDEQELTNQEINDFQTDEKIIEKSEDNSKSEVDEIIKTENKDDYIKEKKREKFIEVLENNPKLFYSLSIEKLERLEEYYKQIIKQQEEKLAKLRQINS